MLSEADIRALCVRRRDATHESYTPVSWVCFTIAGGECYLAFQAARWQELADSLGLDDVEPCKRHLGAQFDTLCIDHALKAIS